MKKLMLILVCLTIVLLSSSTYAQNTKKSDAFKPGWYLGLNGGVNWFMGEGNDFITDGGAFPLNYAPGYLGRLEAGYQFNPVYSVRGFLGYNLFNHHFRNSSISPLRNEKFSAEILSGDLLMNITNLSRGYSPIAFSISLLLPV